MTARGGLRSALAGMTLQVRAEAGHRDGGAVGGDGGGVHGVAARLAAGLQRRVHPVDAGFQHAGMLLRQSGVAILLECGLSPVYTRVQRSDAQRSAEAECELQSFLHPQVLTIFAAVDVLEPYDAVHVFEDANSYMLPLFLLANLLTGGINLAIDTLAVGDWAARGIVAGYLFALCCVATLMSPRRKQ